MSRSIGWQLSHAAMEEEFDEVVLALLSDAELVEQMWSDICDGLGGEIVDATHILLNRGWAPGDILERSLAAGMGAALDEYYEGLMTPAEFVLASDALQAGLEVLRPYLAQPESALPA